MQCSYPNNSIFDPFSKTCRTLYSEIHLNSRQIQNSSQPSNNKFRKFSQIHSLLTKFGISLSLAGLTILALVYLKFPTLQNLPGKNLICLCVAYILVYLLVIVSNFISKYVEESLWFSGLAVGLNYAFMCTFSWMTIISHDICRTFVSINYYSASRDHGDQRRLFRKNLIIGFGIIPSLPVLSGNFNSVI